MFRLPRSPRTSITRDALIFTVGLLGILHETLVADTERPFLLALFAAMIGLTGFLRAEDERVNRGDKSLPRKNSFGYSNGAREVWDEFLSSQRFRRDEED